MTLRHRALDAPCAPETAFAALYGGRRHAVWLDSARTHHELGRFSFLGAAEGELGQVVRYDLAGRRLVVERRDRREERRESVFAYLRDELARLRLAPADLPFDFTGGFVGYLGYELKAECGGVAAHLAPLPDAVLLLADRVVAFDHRERRVHLLALAAEQVAEADAWLEETERTLRALRGRPAPTAAVPPPGRASFALRDEPAAYLDKVLACQERIAQGESYEVCLTTEATSRARVDPLAAYLALRRTNPAPYGALLRLGAVSVLSSSPERFLRVDRRRLVESRPIKGTSARALEDEDEDAGRREALRTDPKSRAENLMVADLVRNDLGRVCALGSVRTPRLMAVESHATVHQMVTVVQGALREGLTAVDAARAAFPGGSMTGAPKERTMEIIDELEGRARGVYSGALGYLALNGTADLSIVIRTLVAGPAGLSIGAGGAIVADSDPEAEVEEMLLKMRPLLRAVGGALATDAPLAAAVR